MTKENVASEEIRRIVEALVEGFKIVDRSDHRDFDGADYWVEKREGFQMTMDIHRLISLGVIEPHPSEATGWRLTDKWHRAYMRSTDELGDGKLYVPE